MNINFDKTDRLIHLIEDSVNHLNYFSFHSKTFLQSRKKDLYKNLIQITATDKSDEQKHLERVKAFAEFYKCEGDLKKAETFLRLEFDEDLVLKQLARAYWQIQTFVEIKDEHNNGFQDIDGLKKFIEKYFPHEIYKDVVADVTINQEPRIKDIEEEFWSNCTDIDKINEFCNIYRERWNAHLKEVDEQHYSISTILFDEENELYKYFKQLRKCGLLHQNELHAEGRLQYIAQAINIICHGIIALFRTFRASTIASQTDDKSRKSVKNKGTKGEETRTLKDIWIEGQTHFNQTVAQLEKINIKGKPFIYKANNNLTCPVSYRYLGAFINRCKYHNLIPWNDRQKQTQEKLEEIINNTFNTRLNGNQQLREDYLHSEEDLRLFEFLKPK